MFNFRVPLLSLSLGLALALGNNAFAQKTMVISSWLPASYSINKVVWPEFIRRIETATEGRVTGKVEYGLASPVAQINLIEDGGADAAWIFNGYSPGRLVTSKLPEIPGLEGSGAAVSAAYWQTYNAFFKETGEYDGVTPVAMMVHAPGTMHLTKKITSLDEVKGLKIRSGGGVMGDVLSALEVTKVQVSAPNVYNTVSNGVADGTFFPGEVFALLRLSEVLPYTYQVPGGFYRGSFTVILNDEFLEDIGEKDALAIKAALGAELSAIAGQALEDGNAYGLAQQAKTGEVIDLDKKAAAKFHANTDMVIQNVLDDINDKGVDADAALAYLRKAISNYPQ